MIPPSYTLCLPSSLGPTQLKDRLAKRDKAKADEQEAKETGSLSYAPTLTPSPRVSHLTLIFVFNIRVNCMCSGTVEDVDKHSRRQVRVTKEQNAEVQRLLKLMGIPCVIVCIFLSHIADRPEPEGSMRWCSCGGFFWG